MPKRRTKLPPFTTAFVVKPELRPLFHEYPIGDLMVAFADDVAAARRERTRDRRLKRKYELLMRLSRGCGGGGSLTAGQRQTMAYTLIDLSRYPIIYPLAEVLTMVKEPGRPATIRSVEEVFSIRRAEMGQTRGKSI